VTLIKQENHQEGFPEPGLANLTNPGNESYEIIKTINLTKRFPLVLALDHINFDLRKGEIHALLGENGAGKTTLSECLYGYYQPDEGEIYYKGKKVILSSPRSAISLGIGMVHQHFVLIRSHSVLENILLGTRHKGFRIDVSKAKSKFEILCKDYGLDINPDSLISQLSVGQQQWVEILRSIYEGIEVLILDEPTAVLTPQETNDLFQVLGRMKNKGLSIIFITHKLKEVNQIADRITILRKGKHIVTLNNNEISEKKLAYMMVGREFSIAPPKNEFQSREPPIVELSDICAFNDQKVLALNHISLGLRPNEILGIAGVSGNGQKELFEVLIGIRGKKTGSIGVKGKKVLKSSPSIIMSLGVGSVPEDRFQEGLIPNFTISENLILGFQDSPAYRIGLFFLNYQAIDNYAKQCISDFEIVANSPQQQIQTLSGGNIQRVILARELSQNPDCLIANQPTRGLDVGAVEYIHKRLLELRDQGAAILLISEDLDEILALSDRIAVMYRGEILKNFAPGEQTIEEIGLMMAGIRPDV
jgi:simple sugar transport system ATP-binding protein